MRGKFTLFLLVLALLVCGALGWTHWKRIDLNASEQVEQAEAERHGFVISHDFNLIKEKLIESHRDQWTRYATVQRLARWEVGGIVVLTVLLSLLITSHLRYLKRQR